MSWINGIGHRLRTLLRPDVHAAELEEEIRAHLELSAGDLRDEGAARRLFGNELGVREETRNQTWLRFPDALRQDLGTALRSLRRSPTTTGLVILTLSLGIGANAITFSLLDRVFVRPPSGVEDPGSLRRFWIEHAGPRNEPPRSGLQHAYPLYVQTRAASDNPENTAAYLPDNFRSVGSREESASVNVTYATANYFSVLGVRPRRGRLYSSAEDSLGAGVALAVVSEAFWRSQLNAREDAIGSTLTLGKDAYDIIGIIGEEFTGIELQAADVWIPLAAMPTTRIGGVPWWQSMNYYALRVVHRLSAQEDPMLLESHATGLHRARARAQKPMRADTLNRILLGPIVAARGPTRGQAPLDQDLIVATRLGGVAFIILLVAWANVINLLLARATQRSREIAVRLALGMSRGRLARLLSVEVLLVAMGSAACATAIASFGGAAFRALLLPDVKWHESVVDARVVVFTLIVAVASAIAAGFFPIRQVTATSLQGTLKSAGNSTTLARRSRLRQGMVVTQAALSVTLLVGAGMFLKSLRNVESLDLGFDARRIVMGSVAFPAGEAPTPEVWSAGTRLVAERMRSVPGVEIVASSNFEPMRALGFMQFYTDSDSSGSFAARFPSFSAVSSNYFSATGLSLLRGTGLSRGAGTEVVVNDAMARMVWPGEEAMGKCIYLEARSNPCHRVVGVIENARQRSVIESEPSPQYYVSVDQAQSPDWASRSVLVRVDGSLQDAVSRQLTSELLNVFPQARPRVRSMMQNLEPQYRPWRLGAVLFAMSGALALAVALIGVYGSLSYTVGQRTREFGIRGALGAQSLTMIRQVLVQELRVVGIGLAIGIVTAIGTARLANQLLYDVRPLDPAILASVTLLVLLVATLAAARPAWRASRVDPSQILRED